MHPSETECNLNEEERKTLASLQTGESAQAKFFADHRDQLRKLANCRIANQLNRRMDASDIMQEAFIEYSNRVSAFLESPRIPPLVWLRRLVRQIVYRKTRDHLDAQCRDVRREQYMADESGVNIDILSQSFSSVGKGIERQEAHDRIKSVLKTMSNTECEIISLVHYEGRTVREAALELGINFEAAKKRYNRALTRLTSLCNTGSQALSSV